MSGRNNEANQEELEELFKLAASIAASVPEQLRETAFNRALDTLLASPTGNNYGSQLKQRKGGGARGITRGTVLEPPGIDPVAMLLEMSRSKAEAVDDEDGALGKSLALLNVAENEFQIDGLTAPQIALVLTQKFKWKVTRQAVTQALDRAGKMVDSKVGMGARKYTVMESGIRYLQTPPDKRDAPASRPQRSRPSPRRSRQGQDNNIDAPSDDTSANPRSVKKGTTGRRSAVVKLIADGFFASPRTLAEVRDELRHRRGLVFKSGDLSPVMTRLLRDGSVTRTRNDEGQYEYVSN